MLVASRSQHAKMECERWMIDRLDRAAELGLRNYILYAREKKNCEQKDKKKSGFHVKRFYSRVC